MEELTLTLNGESCVVSADPMEPLLQVLRRERKLFGAREGCGVGMCGACTVLLDGRPVSSCLLPVVKAVGHEVLTIEGLASPDGELDPVQQAYVDNNGFQCSYCTPGFVLSTKALIEENPDVTEDEARAYLAGNICRCGSYVKILDAVMDAARSARGDGEAP